MGQSSSSDRSGPVKASVRPGETGPADGADPAIGGLASRSAESSASVEEPSHDGQGAAAPPTGTRVGESPKGGNVPAESDAADLQGDGILEGESLPGSLAPRKYGWRQTKIWLVLSATIRSCMRYRVTGLAAEGAFFGVLSLPPLIFGLAGSIGYVLNFLGVGTIETVRLQVLSFARRLLTESSVQEVIDPMVGTVLQGGRADVVSIGFVLALWSGSRALNVFIDTVSIMYGLGGRRGIVKTRALSFSLYTVGLFTAIMLLPLVLAGPAVVRGILPSEVEALADLYWPVVVLLSVLLLTSVYHLAVPVRGRWRHELPGALFVFAAWMVGSQLLRLVLSASIGGTSIYGPLAAPIVVLLWLYFIVISVLIGAALNSSMSQVLNWRRGITDGKPEGPSLITRGRIAITKRVQKRA
jgi:membrane protein